MARKKEFDRTKALEQAMLLFWETGYEATSMDALCKRMGINRQSLYDTFGNKQQLYLEALQFYLHHANVMPAIDDHTHGISLIEKLFRDLIDFSVKDDLRRGCLIANTIAEKAAHTPEVVALCQASQVNFEQLFYDILHVAREQGDIRPERDLHELARFLTNSYYGLRITAKIEPTARALNSVLVVTMRAITA